MFRDVIKEEFNHCYTDKDSDREAWGLHEPSTFNAAFLLVVSIHVVSMGGGSSSLRELKDKKHFNIMIIITIIPCTSVPLALFPSKKKTKDFHCSVLVHNNRILSESYIQSRVQEFT